MGRFWPAICEELFIAMNNLRMPLLLASAALASVSFAQTTFDTMSAWDGQTSIGSFGNPNSATYGQTFTAPTDAVMQDFSFQLYGETGTKFQLRGLIYEWAGNLTGAGGGATGLPVFTSTPQTILGNDEFQQITFAPNMSLVPGKSYVAAISISDPADFDATDGAGSIGFNWYQHDQNNGGGGFVWSNNTNDPSALNGPWTTWYDYGDAAFTAHFAQTQAVPEPASMLALAGGALGVLRRRRRK